MIDSLGLLVRREQQASSNTSRAEARKRERERERERGGGIAANSSFGDATAKSLQERIRQAAEQAATFEQQSALVLVVDSDDTLLHASEGFDGVFGTPTGPASGLRLFEAIATERIEPSYRSSLLADLTAALHQSAAGPIRFVYRHTRDGWRALEGRAYRAQDLSTNWIVVFHDSTENLRNLENMIESERRLRTIAEACKDMVTETNERGRFTYVSGGCEEVLGYTRDELEGSKALLLHHPDEVEHFRKEVLATAGSPRPFEVTRHRLRCKDGRFVWVEATGVRYTRSDGEERVIGVARDVSARLTAERERQDLEERILRVAKLESLGNLAGGVAHDFNNLLTPILGNASLLLADLPRDASVRRWAEAIRIAADRAAELTGQMLAYAGRTEPHVTLINVSTTIQEVSLLLQTTASSGSRVFYDLATDLPCVHGDAAQITQLVMNLVANASDALGENGGQIHVRTGSRQVDRAALDASHLGEDRPQGEYVTIEVEDDGEGLDRETLQRVLDPFFSTRSRRRGLGLSLVLGVVRAHEGAVQVESEEERGTCFRILLPIAKERPRQDECAPSHAGRPALEHRVLVVDDDAGARALTVASLERAGFEVIEAAGGGEAISLYERSSGTVDAVVLDGTMPGMSCTHVFDALQKITPEVRVILVSGHQAESTANALWQRGLAGFVHKPFEPEALAEEVRRLLDTWPNRTRLGSSEFG